MHCKTRENWPFSGLVFDFRVILAFRGYLLKKPLKILREVVFSGEGRRVPKLSLRVEFGNYGTPLAAVGLCLSVHTSFT